MAGGLASAGAAILIADRRLDAAEATAGALRNAGADAVAVATEVTDERDAIRTVQAAVERWGRLDILINNRLTGPPNPVRALATNACCIGRGRSERRGPSRSNRVRSVTEAQSGLGRQHADRRVHQPDGDVPGLAKPFTPRAGFVHHPLGRMAGLAFKVFR
jgi:hypothetical protein